LKVKAVVTETPAGSKSEGKQSEQRKLKVLVAGGGIGGLVFALAAKKKGFDVMVFEKDLSAVRGEGQYRGPIQIQSNALAALEAIDLDVAEEVMRAGCITGDRINGLVDGVSGTWYAVSIFNPTYMPSFCFSVTWYLFWFKSIALWLASQVYGNFGYVWRIEAL